VAKAVPISGIDVDEPILCSSRLIIETRLGEMLNFEPYIASPDHVAELHQMRIAAKRLRYSMEIFQPIYDDLGGQGKEFARATEEIKALQEHLGEIHDADVLVPRLEEHLSRLLRKGYGLNKKGAPRTGVSRVDLDACQGLLTLCLQVRAERIDRYQRFLNDWQQLRDRQFFDNLLTLLKAAEESSVAAGQAGVSAEALL